MKLIKAFAAIAVCAATVLGVAACGGTTEKTGTEYGLVHGHYVGIISVTVKGDEITKVTIDEVECPYSWAKISPTVIETEIAEADRATNEEFTVAEGVARTPYAKKIVIDGVTFTARNNGDGDKKDYVDYFNADKNGSTTFENWLKVSANAKWYYEAMTSGKYDILKADGTGYEVEFKDASVGALSKENRWLKSKNGYWTSQTLGWSGNMNAISNYIVENGFEDYKAARDTLTIDGTAEIVINEVGTGATVRDFKDYMDLAIKAHEKALAA